MASGMRLIWQWTRLSTLGDDVLESHAKDLDLIL